MIDLAAGLRWHAIDYPEPSVLLVERGAVMTARRRAGARRLVVAVAGPEKALLAPARDEEVSALTDAEVRVVPAADAPDELADAVRDREESLAVLALQRHTDRVRAKLVQLARTHGKVVEGGVLIALPLTHDLIADMTASARETVTLALGELKSERFVSRVGRAYVVRVSPADL